MKSRWMESTHNKVIRSLWKCSCPLIFCIRFISGVDAISSSHYRVKINKLYLSRTILIRSSNISSAMVRGQKGSWRALFHVISLKRAGKQIKTLLVYSSPQTRYCTCWQIGAAHFSSRVFVYVAARHYTIPHTYYSSSPSIPHLHNPRTPKR